MKNGAVYHMAEFFKIYSYTVKLFRKWDHARFHGAIAHLIKIRSLQVKYMRLGRVTFIKVRKID